jgi:hypothetical protein
MKLCKQSGNSRGKPFLWTNTGAMSDNSRELLGRLFGAQCSRGCWLDPDPPKQRQADGIIFGIRFSSKSTLQGHYFALLGFGFKLRIPSSTRFISSVYAPGKPHCDYRPKVIQSLPFQSRVKMERRETLVLAQVRLVEQPTNVARASPDTTDLLLAPAFSPFRRPGSSRTGQSRIGVM